MTTVSTHTPEPSRRFNFIYDDDNDDEERTIPLNEIIYQLPMSIAITPVLPTKEPQDSLIMGDENLSTIPKKESDEIIKSSVEDLVSIPRESEDTPDNDMMTTLPKEDVPEENFKIYSNPLFEFDEEYISSDVNSLYNEVLEDIESKDSYVSNLDEPALLVTPLSDANEDECFDLGGDIDEIDAFLDIDVSTDIEDGYHDSEGDVIYLECLLTNDTTHNLPPTVFLDHDPRSLKDEPDNNDSKSMVKVFDPGIHEKIISLTYVRLPFEDRHYFLSHLLSESFFLISLSLWILLFFSPPGVKILSLTPSSPFLVAILLSRCLNPFAEIPSGGSKVHIDVLSVLWGNRLPIPDGLLPLSSLLDHGRLAYRCGSFQKKAHSKNNKSETDKSLLDHGRLAYRCGSFQKGRGSPGRNKTPGPWSARVPMLQLFKGSEE
ncbi:hypothetical protein Tco_0243156 [Tanacetum coccineum]